MMWTFDWDEYKNQTNYLKHHVSFEDAQEAFFDPLRLIFEDIDHSTQSEKRFYCIGEVATKVCTVIRIFGAGYWRKEQKIYEKINKTR
ncbi:MAG TPA: BrnT family toxin [Candidatus Woesebacteria bacterium]|nr:BrnT family toxin [Candidatus Woesebacteria bacterium]